MYLHRTIEENIAKAIQQFPALFLSGARQAGKSTVLMNKEHNASSTEQLLAQKSTLF